MTLRRTTRFLYLGLFVSGTLYMMLPDRPMAAFAVLGELPLMGWLIWPARWTRKARGVTA
jgi:hypothetical protein